MSRPDPNKPNYVSNISDHPELIDINMIQGGGPEVVLEIGGDWFHVNGVDYNEELDQIAFSSRFASENILLTIVQLLRGSWSYWRKFWHGGRYFI